MILSPKFFILMILGALLSISCAPKIKLISTSETVYRRSPASADVQGTIVMRYHESLVDSAVFGWNRVEGIRYDTAVYKKGKVIALHPGTEPQSRRISRSVEGIIQGQVCALNTSSYMTMLDDSTATATIRASIQGLHGISYTIERSEQVYRDIPLHFEEGSLSYDIVLQGKTRK